MKKIIAAFLLLFSCFDISAQQASDRLKQRIGNETNFKKIDAIATKFFKEEHDTPDQRNYGRQGEDEEEFESPMTFYQRWKWFNSSRLDANGNITNFLARTTSALAEREANFSASNNNGQSAFRSSNSDWVHIGPTSYTVSTLNGSNQPVKILDGLGRVDCIAFDPVNAGTMYVGTPMGGIYKTVNGGTTWTPIAQQFAYMGIAGLVVNKTNGNEIWALAGTGENRNTWGIFDTQDGVSVFHSTDAGATWSLQYTDATQKGLDLVQDPTRPTRLYLATFGYVKRSLDGGANWSNDLNIGGAYDLEFSGNGRLFCAGANKIRYSDNGTNFSIGLNLDYNRASLAVSPINNDIVYVLAGPADSSIFKGIYKSTDAGASFTMASNTPNIFGFSTDGTDAFDQSGYDNCIVVNGSSSSEILTGGAAIWKSVNSGQTMAFNTYYWNNGPANQYVHPDVHALKRNPLNGYIYACTDGGVYESQDFGGSWAQKTVGIGGAQLFRMSSYKQNGMLAFGTQDNGLKIRRDSGLYEQFAGADGYATQFSLNDSSVLYGSMNDGFAKYNSFGAHTINCTYPFTYVQNEKWFINIKVTPNAANHELVFAAALDTLSRSTDGGQTWTLQQIPAHRDIAFAPSDPSRIYVLGDFHNNFSMHRNNTYGTGTWTTLTPPVPNSPAQRIAISESNKDNLWICFGGYNAGQKVYHSTNGGVAWANESFNLPNTPVNALAVDDADNVYAGTDVGVFVLPSGANRWEPFFNGLPIVPITDIIIKNASERIFVSTFGCGVYQNSLLYGNCEADYNVGGVHNGRYNYEASNSIQINSFSLTRGFNTTSMVAKAGNYVQMNPGTFVRNGNFLATIAPCGSAFPVLRQQAPAVGEGKGALRPAGQNDSATVHNLVVPISNNHMNKN